MHVPVWFGSDLISAELNNYSDYSGNIMHAAMINLNFTLCFFVSLLLTGRWVYFYILFGNKKKYLIFAGSAVFFYFYIILGGNNKLFDILPTPKLLGKIIKKN